MRYLVSPTYFRSLMKLSHNLSHSFWQVLVVTSALASLQRNEEYQRDSRKPWQEWKISEHCWSCWHGKAFVESKKLIAQGPVSCYFSPQLALILQVNVFRVSVGGGFLQNDQPVVFDSNILQATKQCISHSQLQIRVVTRSFRVARVQSFICMQF